MLKKHPEIYFELFVLLCGRKKLLKNNGGRVAASRPRKLTPLKSISGGE